MTEKIKRGNFKTRRKLDTRQKNTIRFQLPKGVEITYKDFPLLQKYLNERGKIVPRRLSGVTSSEQRQLTTAIKRARQLALLPSGSVSS